MQTFFRQNKIKLISLAEIIIGLILLVLEIRDFMILPTVQEAEDQYGGPVLLFKYKENTYSQLFLWTMLLLTGISYWINKRIYWVLNQAFPLFLLFVILESSYLYSFRSGERWTVYIIPCLLLLLFIWIEIKIVKQKNIALGGVDRKGNFYGILSGLICCCIYFLLL